MCFAAIAPHEGSRELGAIDAHLRHVDGHGLDARTAGAGELADAVDGVVIVERQQIAVAALERVSLADEPQRPAGVRREDGQVLRRIRVEELEHGPARALHVFRHRRGAGIGRVRIPEDVRGQKSEMTAQLALRVKAAAGVIEVDVVPEVEAAVLGRAKPVERRGGGPLRPLLRESRASAVELSQTFRTRPFHRRSSDNRCIVHTPPGRVV